MPTGMRRRRSTNKRKRRPAPSPASGRGAQARLPAPARPAALRQRPRSPSTPARLSLDSAFGLAGDYSPSLGIRARSGVRVPSPPPPLAGTPGAGAPAPGRAQAAGPKLKKVPGTKEGGRRTVPPRQGMARVSEEALPERYGRTLLVAQARDPHWLHAYWEVSDADWARVRADAGASAQRVLRVYELAEPRWDAVRRWFDVELTPEAMDWHLEVRQPAAWWGLELGLRGSQGRFTRFVRSNLVETPADRPSDEVDEAWGLLPGFEPHHRLEHYQRTSVGQV